LARILIADDEDLERTALRFIVTGSGLEEEFFIDEARNGHEAVELGRSGRYDVIFLDIKMPGLDGLRAAEGLRNAGIRAPIIIISAFDTFEYAQRAIRLGVYEYLLKPAGTEEVVSALRRSLEWSRSPDSLLRKREASVSAISAAARKLESSLIAQMKGGSLDGAAAKEYENLSSLLDCSCSVVAFRLQAESGSSGQMAKNVASGLALASIEKTAVRCSRKTIASETDDFGFALIYGLDASSYPQEAGFKDESEGDESRSTQGGFFKNLRSDPFRPLIEAARRRVRDLAPFSIFFGIAGPSAEGAGILFAQALEGVRLASVECPVVRLARLSAEGKDDVRLTSAADASPRSLGMKALDYIKNGYSKELTLVSAAEKLGVNPFHLSHSISRELGIGFSELLRRVRVNKAKELMAGGGSVKEASYLVGFSDQAYFTRVFKKLEGMNPRQFIEQTAKKYKK